MNETTLTLSLGDLCRISGRDGLFIAVTILPGGQAEFVPFDAERPDRIAAAPAIRACSGSVNVVGNRRHLAAAVAMRRRTSAANKAFIARNQSDSRLPDESPAADVQSSSIRTAMIFCAGLGTRLRPLTSVFPKPAVPFFGKPLIHWTLRLLRNAGIQRVVINTHHLPDVMAQTARREAESIGFDSLSISHEPILMDTAGGLREARRFIGEDAFLAVNGDAFLSLNFADIARRHLKSGALSTLCVAPPIPGENFRAIEADPGGRIAKIRGIGRDAPGLSPWHFLGVHAACPELFSFIAPEGPRDINGETYPAAIAAGNFIQALPMPVGAWADLGTPLRYYDACQEVLSGGADLTPFGSDRPGAAGTTIDEGETRSFIDGGAVMGEDVCLKGAVIQGDAVIGRGAHIERSVILPGTHIGSGQTIADAIVWNGGAMAIPADTNA